MFTGCGTALVTPFRHDRRSMSPRLRDLVRRQIDAGIDFLVPCGTTGESPTLTRAEHLRVVEITVEEAAGKVPVLGGAGGYNTHEVIELARELETLGADGILSVTPYYNKPTQEGLYQHYKAIADAVPLPIVVYSVQGRTGVNVEPATLARLAQIENIVGVKEASGNISQMANVMHEVPPDFTVLSGDDAITIPLMALGGRGIVSVVSNEIPAEMTAARASLPARRFRSRARDPAPLPAADERQLRRIEPHSGEGRHGPDGPARSGIPPADGARPAPPAWRRSRRCSSRWASPWSVAALQAEIEALFDDKPGDYTADDFAAVRRIQGRAEPRPRSAPPSRTTSAAPAGASTPGSRKASCWAFAWAASWICPSGALAVLRQVHLPGQAASLPKASVRIVPGGSSIRDGCYLGKGVTCMPPMYINAGAYVGEGTMVDSHALVGSCAQIGQQLPHLGRQPDRRRAGAGRRAAGDRGRRRAGRRQLRRLRRHRGEAPRGARHRHDPQSLHAGLRPGPQTEIYRATDDEPLVIPEEAVVVAGSRAVTSGPGKDWGISIYTPVIVKYRDAKTDTRIQLEDSSLSID